MAQKPRPGKKAGSGRSGDVEDKDKDRLIAELRDRIAFLENDLYPKEGAISLEMVVDSRNNEALRESDEMFRVLADTSSAAVMMHQGQNFVYANGAAETITGYARNELLAMPFWHIVHPDDRGIVKERGLARLRGEVPPRNYEIKLLAKNGEEKWALLSAARTKFGGRSAVILTLIDITERKRAEDALRESERRFRGVYEQAPLGIAVIDSATGHFLQINQKYCDIVGRTMDDMLARNWQSITHQDDIEEDLNNMARLLHGEITGYQMEKRYIHANGSFVWVNLTVVPLWYEYSKNRCHIAMVEDITGRKRAEEELRESEEFNRSTLDSLPMNVAVLNESGTIIFVNQSWMEFGRNNNVCPIESISVGANYIEACRRARGEYSEEAPAALDGILSVLHGESNTFEMEYPCHSPDKKRWFTMRVSRIEALAFRGVIVIHADITLRKLFEEAVSEEKERAELYLDLMAHDINNMNQSAQGFLELALQTLEVDGRIGRNNQLLIEKPLQAVQSSSRLISNVQKLQKLTEDGIKTRPVDLHDVFEEIKTSDFHIGEREATIIIHEVPHAIVGGSDLLRDVFFNLISNAVKHSKPDKPVTIDVRVERVDVDGRSYYRCSVEDDGPGVPDALKPRLFQRFLRGNTKIHGKGLGLYLVRTLVEGYGGRVWVEDRVKGDHTKGARFVVLLPAMEK